jgi:hypothetical protein
MSLQEDCPVCKVIASGKVEAEGDRCCLIRIGSMKVAALKEHSSLADGVALSEAAKLLNYQGSSGFLADYSDVPAHWGLRIIPAADLPSGESRGRSS